MFTSPTPTVSFFVCTRHFISYSFINHSQFCTHGMCLTFIAAQGVFSWLFSLQVCWESHFSYHKIYGSIKSQPTFSPIVKEPSILCLVFVPYILCLSLLLVHCCRMYVWKGRHCDSVYWGDSVTLPIWVQNLDCLIKGYHPKIALQTPPCGNPMFVVTPRANFSYVVSSRFL